jgi:hypothetical protein
MKPGASAVESNSILEALHKNCPQIFKKREKRITALHIPYKGSNIMYVIDAKFELSGTCGNNIIHGKC